MTPTRREVAAGLGAGLLLPRAAVAQAAPFRATLDRAATMPPADALRLIADLAPRTASERLDRATAREGLAIDVALAGTTGAARYALLLDRAVGRVDLVVVRTRIEREQARVLARADRALRAMGLAQGSVGDRYRRLWRDERYLYSDDDAGRDRAVADMNDTLDATRPRMAAWFDALPPEVSRVATRRMSRADEAGGRSGYREVPAPDMAGGYRVDLKDIRRRPSWTLPSVVHHELLPGHMVQSPIEARADQHPLRVRYAAHFPEGWAIYAETLAADYADDAMGELGHLHWLLFRLNRARIDLGINLDGWSAAEARARLIEWQGEPGYFAGFDADLARVVADPAGRTGEALMWLTITDLARGRTGAALRRFHANILADGRKRLSALRHAAR